MSTVLPHAVLKLTQDAWDEDYTEDAEVWEEPWPEDPEALLCWVVTV